MKVRDQDNSKDTGKTHRGSSPGGPRGTKIIQRQPRVSGLHAAKACALQEKWGMKIIQREPTISGLLAAVHQRTQRTLTVEERQNDENLRWRLQTLKKIRRTKIRATPCSEDMCIVGEASDSPSLGKSSVGTFMKISDPENSQGKRKKK